MTDKQKLEALKGLDLPALERIRDETNKEVRRFQGTPEATNPRVHSHSHIISIKGIGPVTLGDIVNEIRRRHRALA